jgi:formylglycine-generating enzyme required for sulfatase activity
MVFIPAGRFTMGASDAEDVYAERPAHEVEIKRFAISTHEVTAGEFARFAGRQAGNGRLPAAFVSWNQALAYTRWLSAQTGKRYRLPSEAEWEYAARAGTTTPYWWGRQLGENNAHCFACESGLDPRKTTQVGRFKPNAFGLYDTAGNVEEWVHDCFHASYQGAPNDGSVFEGGDCPNRVARGGAFSSGPQGLRVTARNKFPQSSANDGLGFRVVREP